MYTIFYHTRSRPLWHLSANFWGARFWTNLTNQIFRDVHECVLLAFLVLPFGFVWKKNTYPIPSIGLSSCFPLKWPFLWLNSWLSIIQWTIIKHWLTSFWGAYGIPWHTHLYGCVWKCCVPHCTQWFCWSLSLWKMAISLGRLTQHFQVQTQHFLAIKWLFHWEYTQHFQVQTHIILVKVFGISQGPKSPAACRFELKVPLRCHLYGTLSHAPVLEMDQEQGFWMIFQHGFPSFSIIFHHFPSFFPSFSILFHPFPSKILEHVGKCWKRMENDGKCMNPKGVKMIEHDGNDGKWWVWFIGGNPLNEIWDGLHPKNI